MLPYRQVHLDFHTSECIEGIGARFSKKQFIAALKEGNVNSVSVFAKCHHGWAYFNAEKNEIHPTLNGFELLDAQLEAAIINSVLTGKVMRLIRDAADVAEV